MDDGNPCTELVCDQAVGVYVVPLPDGTPCEVFGPCDSGGCDDGNPCSPGGTCQGGECVPGPDVDCDDLNPCTMDVCDPAVGCVHIPLPVCECDNDLCTEDWVEAGVCYSVPIDCDDGDPCTVDTCDPAIGCVHHATEECNGTQPMNCHDAQDNDGDGYTDMDDWDCHWVPCCPGPEVCDNGIDDDLDGLVDCADADCAADSACG